MLKDPEFREEWERTALARAVAEAVIRYRAERGLSQTALARLLGWSQPVVARLEAAEHDPSMDTLVALARKLSLRVHVDVEPTPEWWRRSPSPGRHERQTARSGTQLDLLGHDQQTARR